PRLLSRRPAPTGDAVFLYAGGGGPGSALSRRGDPARHPGQGSGSDPATSGRDPPRLSAVRPPQPPILHAADRAGAAAYCLSSLAEAGRWGTARAGLAV